MTSRRTYFAVISGAVIGTLLIGLGSTLLPLLLAMALAYFLFPVLQRLEKKGLPREYAVAGVLIGVALVATLVFLLVVPRLIVDAKDFALEMPQNSAVIIERVEEIALRFGYELDLSKQGITDLIKEHISDISGDLLKSTSAIIKRVFSNFIGALIAILNLFLIPLFFFHLINNYESISSEIKNLIPPSLRPKLDHYVRMSNSVLSGYVRGQGMVALILASLYATGFSLIGLRFGFLIGIITGMLSIIPFVGGILGLFMAVAVALANYAGISMFVAIASVFAIVQALEGLVITPKLVGDKVGLNALTTMLALIIGGNLLGLVGMILAIPAAAILKEVLRELKEEYQSSAIYKG